MPLKTLFPALFCCLLANIYGQIPDTLLRKEQNRTEGCILPIENRPQFPGGEKALALFLEENLRYPIGDACAQGKVFLRFIIEKDGSITDIKVLRGIGERYDAEAIKVVKKMPKWIPARSFDNKEIIRVQYTLPIMFR